MASRWCSKTATVILATIVAMVLANAELPKQTVELKSFSECEARGTDELRFAVTGRDGVFSGSVIFKRPLDNSIHAVTEISRWQDKPNEWGRTFHVHRVEDACVGFLGIVPSFGRSISQCMGVEDKCPLSEGEYQLENCDLRLDNVTRKLPAGEFRLAVSLKNATHVLGCINVVVEVANVKPE